MIPKIIHFVWVGNQPKPQLVLDCIASWKKFCPDYKIIEWNNDSLLKINNRYVQQAFENKKWAFVSDWLRLYALEKFGGFYFDSDLEITQNIDKFRDNKFITGHEMLNNAVFPFTAFMGSEPGGTIVKTLLSEYDNIDFVNPDGTFNQMTNTVRVSNLFGEKYGVVKPYDGTKRIKLADDGVIEPWWFFCTPRDNYENYSIHHFNGSWVDGFNRKTKIKIWRFELARFRRIFRTNTVPLKSHEHIVLRIKTAKNTFYAIIYRGCK